MNIPEHSHAIDRLLTQTRAHHVQLSVMADVKANIMLTLSSLVVTFLFRFLNDPLLRWPVAVMMLFSGITVMMAAYAVMPKLNIGKQKRHNNSKNLLFFGNFQQMPYEEYAEKMEKILLDNSSVYEAQVREVYEMGIFLGKNKYRFIRYAYISFILGLICSGLAYLLVVVF